MASLGRIIGCTMVILIIAFATIIIIILACAFTGRLSNVLSLNKSPVGNLGENQLLSCFLQVNTPAPLSQTSVTWTKSGVSGVVYQVTRGAVALHNQIPQFKGRAALSLDALQKGNASLILSGVRSQDQGEYTCSVSSSTGAGTVTVDLRTGAFSAPSFTFSSSILTAVAERWSPEPNVTWSDLRGAVLPGTTSLNLSSAGVYSVKTSLSPVNTSDTYTLMIENNLKISISQATVTGTGVEHQTYLYTNRASSPPLASTQLVFIVICIALTTFP